MIPPFDRKTGNLPAGIHRATWGEVVKRFGTGGDRGRLLVGFELAISVLRAAGCRRIYLDGSFVTSKKRPRDYDACWEGHGVDAKIILERAPSLLGLPHLREEQRRLYRGDLFVAETIEAGSGLTFLEFFQVDKLTGEPKGIVMIELEQRR